MPRIITRIAGKKSDWLVNLRWIASVCVIIATFVSSEFLHLPVRTIELYILAVILFGLNLAYRYLTLRVRDGSITRLDEQNLIVIQIITDLSLLTCLLHFSGGVENPFIIYYIFHQMIASILLPKKTAYMLTTYSLFLVALLASLEYFSLIPHYSLEGFIKNSYYNQISYLAGTGFVFVTTSFIVIYITGAIVDRLKKAENSYRLANIRLEEKDKIKDEYVYRLSHDIKGHIAAIKSNLDAARIVTDTNKIREFELTALHRVELLTDFIKNLLRITRLRLNKEYEVTSFSLKEVIEEIILLYKENIENKKINFHTFFEEQDSIFMGDRFSISEAIANLVSNAIKYTGEGGSISVRLGNSKGYFNIEIEDSGIGIPEDEQENIFKEFFRAKNAAELHEEGDGLGLAITKQIIDNHKGKIGVKSIESKGTKIIVKLPV